MASDADGGKARLQPWRRYASRLAHEAAPSPKSWCAAGSSSTTSERRAPGWKPSAVAGATYFILDLGRYADQREFIREAETFMTRVAR